MDDNFEIIRSYLKSVGTPEGSEPMQVLKRIERRYIAITAKNRAYEAMQPPTINVYYDKPESMK